MTGLLTDDRIKRKEQIQCELLSAPRSWIGNAGPTFSTVEKDYLKK